MLKLAFEYINYLRRAKNRHGIHSPFVYKLSDEILRLPLKLEDEEIIKTFVSSLRRSQETIDFHEFGSGSKLMGQRRKVTDMQKNSSSKGKFGRLLYRLSSSLNDNAKILEFGTSLGVGTLHLHLGNKNAVIHTLEACPNTFRFTTDNFPKWVDSENVHFHNQTFLDYLNRSELPLFDLVFVDGHHDGEALAIYMEMLKKCTHADTIFVLDDIRWSSSMWLNWNKLVNSSDFHVSIDLFRMGILVPRPQQRKEAFYLWFEDWKMW